MKGAKDVWNKKKESKSDAVIWYSCDKTTNINTCYMDEKPERCKRGGGRRNTELWSHIFIKTEVSSFGGAGRRWRESLRVLYTLRIFIPLLCYENYILFIYFQHTHFTAVLMGETRNIIALCFLWMRNISLHRRVLGNLRIYVSVIR